MRALIYSAGLLLRVFLEGFDHGLDLFGERFGFSCQDGRNVPDIVVNDIDAEKDVHSR